MAAQSKGTILITGANGGLGSAMAKHISSTPEMAAYHGLYAVRDATRADALRAALDPAHQHSHDILSMDLTNLASVRQTASDITSRIKRGDIPPIKTLILNAGFQDFGHQTWTDSGLDTTFSANYLGHWLLTVLLLGSMDKESGSRIVVVGSQSHDPHDPRNKATGAFTTPQYQTFLQDGQEQAIFSAIARGTWSPASEDTSWRSGYRRYGASKLFLIMAILHSLQHRLDRDPNRALASKIAVVGVDPGGMSTGMQRNAPWFMRYLIFGIIYPIMTMLWTSGRTAARTTARSAADVLWAAFDVGEPLPGPLPKSLYFDGRELLATSKESRDEQKWALVWRETAKLANLREGETALADWR